MTLDQEYKYFAFISYNQSDEKWGKRVRDKLEGYRMPTTLCSERGWERKPIKPVFFAPSDIQPGPLTDELKGRLRASRNLIVICSPNSAQSKWVGMEIEYFYSLGRGNNIHFFIVDGVPHSGDSATECFNPIIEEIGMPEILGANINEKVHRWKWLNRERAYVQLITKLLNVEFDSIWQRHKRALYGKIVTISLIFIFILSLIIGGYLYYRPHYAYFAEAELVQVGSELTISGISPLEKDEIDNRWVSFRFTYSRPTLFSERKLSMVEKINSAFRPENNATSGHYIEGLILEEWPIFKLRYNDSMHLINIIGCDRLGTDKVTYYLSSIETFEGKVPIVDIKRNNQTSNDLGTIIDDKTTKANIHRYTYSVDDYGYINKINFHKHSGNLYESQTMNNSHVFGYSMTRDSIRHKILKVQSIDNDNKPMVDIDNVSTTCYEYDSIGRVISLSYWDNNGQRVRNKLHSYHKVKYEYDIYNNKTRSIIYDEDNHPALGSHGYSIQVVKYERGMPIKISEYDQSGRPINLIDKKIHSTTFEYDNNKNLVREIYFDKHNKMSPSSTGASSMYYEYDKDGNCILKSYQDANYKPVVAKGLGYATVRYKYNSHGQGVEGRCYDENDNPTLNLEGYFKQVTEYDHLGNVSKIKFYDKKDNLVNNNLGYAIAVWNTFSELNGGSTQKVYFLDNNNKPCIHLTLKVHKIVSNYDENGNKIQDRFYSVRNKLCVNNRGYAISNHKYDNFGRNIKNIYLNVDSIPTYFVLNSSRGEYDLSEVPGYYSDSTVYISNHETIKYFTVYNDLTNKFDRIFIVKHHWIGDMLQTSFFNADFHPTVNAQGYSSRTVMYDKYRKPTQISYFDSYGAPCEINGGISKFIYVYDERSNPIKTLYFNKFNNRTMYNGMSCIVQKYDEKDRVISLQCFDCDDKPLNINGVHKQIKEYDLKGNVCKITFFSAYAKDELRKEIYTHDIASRVTSTSYYVGNKLKNNAKGIAKILYKYNCFGQIIELMYFDEKGRPVINPFFKQQNIYTLGPLLSSTRYYDCNNICIGEQTYFYDSQNNVIDVKVSNFTKKHEYFAKPVVMIRQNNKPYILVSIHDWDLSKPIDEYLHNLIYLIRSLRVYNMDDDVISDIQLMPSDNISLENIPHEQFNHILNMLIQQ